MSDDDMVLWGTIYGWAKRLGIAEDVLRERFKDLRSQATKEPTIRAYPQPDVLEACSDLLRPQMVDSDGLVAKGIRNDINEEHEGP